MPNHEHLRGMRLRPAALVAVSTVSIPRRQERTGSSELSESPSGAILFRPAGGEAVSRVLKSGLLIFGLSAGCSHSPAAPDSAIAQPAWVTTVIRQLETEPVANPPAVIASYQYKGDTVYFVPQRCCDVMSVVYRADGAIMCKADGGFAGTGDGRCPDFIAERRNERIVWRDPRK
jgi:hypothetical protein